MIMYVSLSRFRDEFMHMGRKDSFSYEGLETLYNYLIEMEESSDDYIQLDVIGLCSDYEEYADEQDLLTNYPSLEDMNRDRWHERFSTYLPVGKTGRIIISE